MPRIDYTFTRTGKFTTYGAVSIEVENPEDASEITAKLDALSFVEMVNLHHDFEDDEWEFEFANTGNTR